MFNPTEEHQALRDMVRSFAQDEVDRLFKHLTKNSMTKLEHLHKEIEELDAALQSVCNFEDETSLLTKEDVENAMILVVATEVAGGHRVSRSAGFLLFESR